MPNHFWRFVHAWGRGGPEAEFVSQERYVQSRPLWDSSSKIHFCHAIAIPVCRGMVGVWCSMEGYCDHGVTKISCDMGWPVNISTANSECWPYSGMHIEFYCWFVRNFSIWVSLCLLLSKAGRSFGKFSCWHLTTVHWTHPNFHFSLPRVFHLHGLNYIHKCPGLFHKSIPSDSCKCEIFSAKCLQIFPL